MAKPTRKRTWSNIDVFGLLNGISTWDDQYKNLKYVRKPFEQGLEVRAKIFRNLKNKPGITKQGLLNGLSNEFGLQTYNVENRTVFELTLNPVPLGAIDVQDISGYYKIPGSDVWEVISPQIWGQTYNQAKLNKLGFIVWQQERYANLSGIKNFQYSNIVEVFNPLPDKTELKFVYSVYVVDENNEKQLVQFTDMDNPEDPYDVRFQFRSPEDFDLSNQVVVYNLDDIPEELFSKYYSSNGIATEFLYSLKGRIDEKYKHKWSDIKDLSTIWDIHKFYGSGQIPHFYDAEAPINNPFCSIVYTGFYGGIESFSDSLYPKEILESGELNGWYLKVFPGKFFIDGISFYFCENPRRQDITFVSGEATIPSGLTRGMYTIMAKSGYFDSYCNFPRDTYLSGVYEDYTYPIGEDAESIWTHIYRRKPYLTSEMETDIPLELGEYQIDFKNNRILSEGITDVTLVWDQTLLSSGTLIPYDLNPLNDQNIHFEKFFLYLSLDPTRTT